MILISVLNTNRGRDGSRLKQAQILKFKATIMAAPSISTEVYFGLKLKVTTLSQIYRSNGVLTDRISGEVSSAPVRGTTGRRRA